MGEKEDMDQKEIIRLLENMMKGADQLLEAARKKNTEANNPKSDNNIIRDCIYADLQYFNGYKQGINLVMQNIRKYYYAEEVKQNIESAQNLKLESSALYGANCYSDTDALRTEAKNE